MKRVMVIGCPGSGKSYFSKKLSDITGLPLYHLDLLYWNEDRTHVEKPVFVDKMIDILKTTYWIIDGNYNSTIELRLKVCDTVIFLDYPLNVCLNGIREREGAVRDDVPWESNIGEQNNDEFISFIENYEIKSKPVILDLLKKYSKKDVYIFHSREEADLFLNKQLH